MSKKDNIKIPRDRWRFYRMLEEELIKFDKYIPVDSKQLDVKSPKLAEIIYSACIHFDSLLKEIAIQTKKLKKDGSLMKKDKPEKRANDTVWPTIRNYEKFFPEFSEERKIFIKRLRYGGDERKPFLGWPRNNPIWWKCYNSLKHDMYNNWKDKASYEYAIQALGALLICNFECEIRRNPNFGVNEFSSRLQREYNIPFIEDIFIPVKNEFVTYTIHIGFHKCYIETDFFKYERNRDNIAFIDLQYYEKSVEVR